MILIVVIFVRSNAPSGFNGSGLSAGVNINLYGCTKSTANAPFLFPVSSCRLGGGFSEITNLNLPHKSETDGKMGENGAKKRGVQSKPQPPLVKGGGPPQRWGDPDFDVVQIFPISNIFHRIPQKFDMFTKKPRG